MNDLQNITMKVAGVSDVIVFGEVINVQGLINEMITELQRLKKEVTWRAVELLVDQGPQKIGEMSYWPGADKEYKSRDLVKTTNAVIEACGGDWQRFTDCLSSNAFKPGAVRDLLTEAGIPDQFDVLFETVERWDVRDGKRAPKLQSLNEAFIKARQKIGGNAAA
jgi:hypothetical protein